ncbi:MAG: hypothetical protein AABO41_20065 [Acidobacteriota bacterium]
MEFNESTESIIYYFFRREFGTISDVELAGILQPGRNVPLDKVVQSFSNIRYYDARPPMIHLQSQLWTDYFPSLLSGSQYDEKLKANRIEVSVSETAKELQAAYGSGALRRDERSALFPKPSWIAGAFDNLVAHKLAIPPADSSDKYVILYKPFRQDVRERFARMHTGQRDRASVEPQEQLTFLPLLPEPE